MGAKRIEGLLIERLEGELLVVNEATQEAHALNETAAIVFELCDGETSRAAMAAEVARRTGLPADESVVALAVAELAEAGLVVPDEPAAEPITRRPSAISSPKYSRHAASSSPAPSAAPTFTTRSRSPSTMRSTARSGRSPSRDARRAVYAPAPVLRA